MCNNMYRPTCIAVIAVLITLRSRNTRVSVTADDNTLLILEAAK